ncbi:MAG: AbrB/MazE/SpoVT family DNA-binding domain-containing protein [bacterium]|nr:AbrB/MazE/SpoVT family DNA-binding domain-containing protein [bacterium]
MEKRKVQKWGNSLAIRLPKEITQKLRLKEGSPVAIDALGNKMQLRPIQSKKENLDDLLEAITDANKHKEEGWGNAQGKEAW